jgi:alpha-galactosidase
MGWNSWEAFRLNIDEGLIRSMADAVVSAGMRDAGYEFIVVDAGWKGKIRDTEGRLTIDRAKFPSGMKALAEYVHGKGLKFGVYTDAGAEDCVSGTPGSKGHEAQDAALFAGWGVDFLKEDWCKTEGMNAEEAYTRMGRALESTGRPIVFSVCEWGDNRPWNWAAGIAHMWRTTGDSKPCWDCGRETMKKPGGYPRGWTLILDAQPPLQAHAGPGHWNDPDILMVGNRGMTAEEARAHFSLWSILAAPLIATNDLRSMSPEILSILTNPEVIAVDQDPLGSQGTRVKADHELEIWARPLADGGKAVVLFNRSGAEAKIGVRWTEIGFAETDAPAVRDLWKHRDLGKLAKGYSAWVPSHGVAMFKVAAARRLVR